MFIFVWLLSMSKPCLSHESFDKLWKHWFCFDDFVIVIIIIIIIITIMNLFLVDVEIVTLPIN